MEKGSKRGKDKKRRCLENPNTTETGTKRWSSRSEQVESFAQCPVSYYRCIRCGCEHQNASFMQRFQFKYTWESSWVKDCCKLSTVTSHCGHGSLMYVCLCVHVNVHVCV